MISTSETDDLFEYRLILSILPVSDYFAAGLLITVHVQLVEVVKVRYVGLTYLYNGF
jgi:hypothetical protein